MAVDDLPLIELAPIEERAISSREYDYTVVERDTIVYDGPDSDYAEALGRIEAGTVLRYYGSDVNDVNGSGTHVLIADPELGEAVGEDFSAWIAPEDLAPTTFEFEQVTPQEPTRDWNTVAIPDIEGLTYSIDDEPVSGTVDIPQGESLFIDVDVEPGHEFAGKDPVGYSFFYEPEFDHLEPTDASEGWEADETRWYSQVPASNEYGSYSGLVTDYGYAVNRDAEDSMQEFDADTQVYASPDIESTPLGELFPTDGAVWWGYLADQDFWFIYHEYTGAVGFVPGESHRGEQPEEEEGSDIPDDGAGEDAGESDAGPVELSLDTDEVEPGDEITLYADGFTAGEDVEVTFNPELAVGTADEEGAFTTVVTIPEDTEPGDYEMTVTGQESGAAGAASFTVIAGAASGVGDDEVDSDESTDEESSEESSGESAQESSEQSTDEDASQAEAQGSADDGELAETGADTRLGMLAGFLVAVGAGLMGFARRGLRPARRKA